MSTRILLVTLFVFTSLSAALAETVTVGTTHSDFWDYGCSPHRIAHDSLGGLHVVYIGVSRWICYSFRTPTGAYIWYTNNFPVLPGNSSGSPSIGLYARQIATISGSRPTTSHGYTTVIGVDDGYQVGAFNEFSMNNPTNPPTDSIIYPTMAIDHYHKAHVFSIEKNDTSMFKRIFYSRDTSTFSYAAHMTNFQLAESTLTNACVVVASRTTDRIVMAWAKPIVTFPNLYFENDNDLYFVQSTNGGITWGFNTPTNVTRYATTDSFRFYNDAAMIFDNQNHLHIVYVSRGGYPEGEFPHYTFSPCLLKHWTETRPDSFDIVANGWWFPSDTHPLVPYQATISRPALSIATNGDLYCVFTRYAPNDTGANGWACGDVWATVSADNGNNWYYPTNLTNTPANAGASGQVHSELYPSVQEVINNDSLYIMYLDDRAGGISDLMSDSTQQTLNQVNVMIARTSVVQRDSLLPNTNFWWQPLFALATPQALSITYSNGNAYLIWKRPRFANSYKLYGASIGNFQPSNENLIAILPAATTMYTDANISGHRYYVVTACK